jgi:hypothetical protein
LLVIRRRRLSAPDRESAELRAGLSRFLCAACFLCRCVASGPIELREHIAQARSSERVRRVGTCRPGASGVRSAGAECGVRDVQGRTCDGVGCECEGQGSL